MPFISHLINRPVVDSEGEALGRVDEIYAVQSEGMTHPKVTALAVRNKGILNYYPISEVTVLFSPVIPLAHPAGKLEKYTLTNEELPLIQDILDKQILDTNGIRVVRVNDLEITRVNGDYYVSNVDIGSAGIMRRMGVAKPLEGLINQIAKRNPQNFISWDYVEPLRHDEFMHLTVPVDKIKDLHPADIAELISDMSHSESGQLLESLDIEHLADALEEVEPDFQATLVQNMTDEKVADVLDEMSPDEAADLLAEMPKERSEDLLELMQDEERDDVKLLLSYPDDSAGGLMTTDLVTVAPDLTANQAIDAIRGFKEEVDSVIYVYVVDNENHLLGTFSLSDLIFATPRTRVNDFMRTKVVTANVLEKQDELAQVVSKYNLQALPVVDDENRLMGMVTADDALDKIIPTAWKKRLPRFY
ncbi:MAG: CBS domain-containing protein [Anaerolineaceae bacterium]|jgi:CBS domain-containing protein/sporulation protein YlmC with PRC-barrel domain